MSETRLISFPCFAWERERIRGGDLLGLFRSRPEQEEAPELLAEKTRLALELSAKAIDTCLYSLV